MKQYSKTMTLSHINGDLDISATDDLGPDDVFNMLAHALGSFIYVNYDDDIEGRKKAIDELMVILDNSYKIPKFIKQDNNTLN